jgi:1-phosphofructokinase
VDTSGSTLQAVLSAAPQLIKPNAHELAEVTGRLINTIGDVTAAAEHLRAKGLDTVLVSLGRDGAVLVDGNGALHGRTRSLLSTPLGQVMHFWLVTLQRMPPP